MALNIKKVGRENTRGEFINTKELLQYPAIAMHVKGLRTTVAVTWGKYQKEKDGSQKYTNFIDGELFAFDSEGNLVRHQELVSLDCSNNVYRQITGRGLEAGDTFIASITKGEYYDVNEVKDMKLYDAIVAELERREAEYEAALNEVPDQI